MDSLLKWDQNFGERGDAAFAGAKMVTAVSPENFVHGERHFQVVSEKNALSSFKHGVCHTRTPARAPIPTSEPHSDEEAGESS